MFDMVGPEALLVSLAFLVALLRPQLGSVWFRKTERIFWNFSRKRKTSVLACGLLALVVRLAILPLLPIPYPFVHDEFSHLLAADTFAHYRLTNPTHAMWVHFETFHVIFKPTYASMYPPLQGMVLAVGRIVGGHPFWGVWFSAGLMCASMCWMLQAWLPSGWAFLGGLLPVMRFGVFSYWDNSYWGGALAATGGAIVLGALPRIIRLHRVRDSCFMAIGLGMLADTRPYEGFVLALSVLLVLALWITSPSRPHLRVVLGKVVLPIMILVVLFAVGNGYYYWRVTGSAFQMPQQLNRDTYALAKYFYWQPAYREPLYHHETIRDFYRLENEHFVAGHTLSGITRQIFSKLALTWTFYIGPLFTIPMLFLPWVVRDRRLRTLVFTGAVSFAGSMIVVFFNIHYVAPITAVLLAAILQGMRHLRAWQFEGRPTGLFLARAMVVCCVIAIPLRVHMTMAAARPGSLLAMGADRMRVVARLNALPGGQLVLVRYQPDHDPLLEWVYNAADIDGCKVVWARDMGRDGNGELFRYFKDRKVWLLQPDISLTLSPYPRDEILVQHKSGAVAVKTFVRN